MPTSSRTSYVPHDAARAFYNRRAMPGDGSAENPFQISGDMAQWLRDLDAEAERDPSPARIETYRRAVLEAGFFEGAHLSVVSPPSGQRFGLPVVCGEEGEC